MGARFGLEGWPEKVVRRTEGVIGALLRFYNVSDSSACHSLLHVGPGPPTLGGSHDCSCSLRRVFFDRACGTIQGFGGLFFNASSAVRSPAKISVLFLGILSGMLERCYDCSEQDLARLRMALERALRAASVLFKTLGESLFLHGFALNKCCSSRPYINTRCKNSRFARFCAGKRYSSRPYIYVRTGGIASSPYDSNCV